MVNAILGPMIVIVGVLILSKIMEQVDLFAELGKNTLFLCGSEYIVKLLVSICLQTVGLKIALSNPISAYLYTFALLILCHKVLVPIEKGVLKKMGLLSDKKI
jgi:fucose 4-O-acetylase-like acetyltransferase